MGRAHGLHVTDADVEVEGSGGVSVKAVGGAAMRKAESGAAPVAWGARDDGGGEAAADDARSRVSTDVGAETSAIAAKAREKDGVGANAGAEISGSTAAVVAVGHAMEFESLMVDATGPRRYWDTHSLDRGRARGWSDHWGPSGPGPRRNGSTTMVHMVVLRNEKLEMEAREGQT